MKQQKSISRSGPIPARRLAVTAMAAALLAVISQISLPMPTGVPITIQVYGVVLIGVILGWRDALWAVIVYILLGAAGAPVFANFRGGLHVLTGLTGGYLFGWPVMVLLSGIRPDTGSKRWNTALILTLSLIGLAVDEFIGGLQWYLLAGDKTALGIFAYSMTAFVPKDVILTVLAVTTGLPMRRLLRRAGILM